MIDFRKHFLPQFDHLSGEVYSIVKRMRGQKDNDTALAVKDLALAVHESLRLIGEILEKCLLKGKTMATFSTFNYPFRELMTLAQRNVMDALYSIESLKEEAAACIQGISDAESAVVLLPHTNESGFAVIHGCNMAVENVASYWVARLSALERMIDRQTFLEITGLAGDTAAIHAAIRRECFQRRNAKI